ncbi:MAG: hypothetical protein AVDCRST_MAG17-592 [uncultured Solirubrobacterales bacterium]|uniref:Uncharacterized protein n=1 Tax=uncultured Solirubrobacterales bacterium TaxID=768556 RepID=A0A6J4S2W4_9ACTN|nr:MAG: hypothetical protein AVDCRST_MAG17-592 [uncultured Solirubrobacterales bacterium]
MLGVDGVVLHGGVEPQAVALFAVVEGSLERLARRAGNAGAGATATATTTSATSPRALVAVLVLSRSRLVLRFVGGQGGLRHVLRLGLRVERCGYERVVLGAQVDLDLLAGPRSVGGGLLGRDQLVLPLEGGDVAGRDLELMGDPRVGTTLADPAADLVELGLQRAAGHGRGETSNRAFGDASCARAAVELECADGLAHARRQGDAGPDQEDEPGDHDRRGRRGLRAGRRGGQGAHRDRGAARRARVPQGGLAGDPSRGSPPFRVVLRRDERRPRARPAQGGSVVTTQP